ncbi:hypothetical protein B296_00045143 [Ensete ventricosum]|uniref:Uncharacterized protein n=1 Tax=Ensete ventricosum TaxID=4639 RepID=A0A426Z8A7_ENSVE|nr:hypothetical protein B296_00045143 [Ensete ventricosum]
MIRSVRRRKTAVLLLGVLLMLTAEPPFLGSATAAEGARPAEAVASDGHESHQIADELTGEDKRQVPTGANPLHNR